MKSCIQWIFLAVAISAVTSCGGYLFGQYLAELRMIENRFPELSLFDLKRLIQRDMSRLPEGEEGKRRLEKYRNVSRFLTELTYFGGTSYNYNYDESVVPRLVHGVYASEIQHFQRVKTQTGCTNFPPFLLSHMREYFKSSSGEIASKERVVAFEAYGSALLLKQYRDLDPSGYGSLIAETNSNEQLCYALKVLNELESKRR